MKLKTLAERGQALIIITLAAIGLFGIVGLAIDGSAKFSDQRHAQNAADTAALAASLAKANELTKANLLEDTSQCPPASGYPNTICSALLAAGKNIAGINGYDNNLTSNTVEIYSPPVSGHYAGSVDFVQVIITSYVNTYFARVIGINQTRNIVQAVALARPSYNLANGAMLISYDPHPSCNSGGGSGGSSLYVMGSSDIFLNGGGIFVNSQENCGYYAPSCPNINITSGGINSAATVDNINQDGCTKTAPENIAQTPVDIPDDVYWPPVPPECGINPPPAPTKLGEVMAGSPPKLTGEWLIYPGFYETFPPSNLVGNKQLIYMKSGVYCIDPPMNQDLSWSPVDFVSLNGSTSPSQNKYHTYNPDGVTLYIKAGGGFTINSNNPTLLDATTKVSSDYQGYLIILEGSQSSHPTCTITGGANLYINGTIFAPYCNIKVNGNSTSTAPINAQLLGWQLTIDGKAGINFNYDPSNQVKIKRRIGLIR